MEREQAMNALNHIDPALIEAADLPAKGRKPRWVRMALTAACVCVALLGVVYAVEAVAGIRFTGFYYDRRFEWPDGKEGLYDGYRIYGGSEFLPVDSMPEEIMKIAQEHADEDYISLKYSSLETAEASLGLNIQDNPVLDEMGKRYFYNTPDVKNAHCAMWMVPSADGPRAFDIYAFYSKQDSENGTVFIDVHEGLFTDLITNFSPEEAWSEMFFHTGAGFEQSEYVTPSGLEASIIRIDPSSEDDVHHWTLYRAYFSLNGVRFELEAKSVSEEENPEFALAVLQEVLDGFS